MRIRAVVYLDFDYYDVGSPEFFCTFDGNRPICPQCGRAFSTLNRLKTHCVFSCRNIKRFQCFFCDYRSKRRFDIWRHMKSRHSSELDARRSQGLMMEVETAVDVSDLPTGSEDEDVLQFLE